MVLPVCLFVLAQYFGSFPFITHLSSTALSICRMVGLCPAEPLVPATESLILFSHEAARVFSFNARTLLAFIAIAFVCLAMNAVRTDRVAACYVTAPLRGES